MQCRRRSQRQSRFTSSDAVHRVTLKSSALTHTPLILDYYWQQPQRSKRQHASAECCPVVGPAPPSARLGEHRPTQHAPPLWMCVPPRVASNRAFSGARSGRRHVHFVGPANAAVANRTPRVITLSVLTRSATTAGETDSRRGRDAKRREADPTRIRIVFSNTNKNQTRPSRAFFFPQSSASGAPSATTRRRPLSREGPSRASPRFPTEETSRRKPPSRHPLSPPRARRRARRRRRSPSTSPRTAANA